jgi:hypothetical protein
MHLHEWIMVEHALPRAAEFSFLHLRTSRYVTIDLTEVHARFKFLYIYRVNQFLFSIINILVLNVIFIIYFRYYFIGFCCGVIVLAQKNQPHKIRLLNPLIKTLNTMFEA